MKHSLQYQYTENRYISLRFPGNSEEIFLLVVVFFSESQMIGLIEFHNNLPSIKGYNF